MNGLAFVFYIIAIIAVVALCRTIKALNDKVGTLQSEVNFLLSENQRTGEEMKRMNRETLRILSEKVVELEDRL